MILELHPKRAQISHIHVWFVVNREAYGETLRLLLVCNSFVQLLNSFLIMEAFIIIISLIWGILSLILFFKVWGMTNDVRRMTQDHFGELQPPKGMEGDFLRRNLIMGNTDIVRKSLLAQFIDEITTSFEQMIPGQFEEDKGWEDYREKNLQKSIAPQVQNLKKQFDAINQPLPKFLTDMKTYNDFFSLFAAAPQGENIASDTTNTQNN